MRGRRLGWLGAAFVGGGLALMAAGAAFGGGAQTGWGPGWMMGPGGMGPGIMGWCGVPGASASPAGSPGPAPLAQAGATEVRMAGSRFAPSEITVSVGASGAWINDDSLPHIAIATERPWSSGNLAPGDRYTREFTAAWTLQAEPLTGAGQLTLSRLARARLRWTR